VNYNKILFLAFSLLSLGNVYAGNDTKRGQGGAAELLINPWARSAGLAGANSGTIRGIESMGLNVAGLAAVRRTEFNFCSALYLVGSDVRINSLGFGTKVGEGVMGLTLSAFNLGDFLQTTNENPDGTGIVFSPQIFNFGASYAKNFSKRISAGLLVRGASQSAYSASVFGLAFDAGIQYQSGKRKEFKFGVSLLNLGPKINFGGDAFSTRATVQGTGYSQSAGLLTAAFEQSSMLNLGVGYDFYVESDVMKLKLTPCFNFIDPCLQNGGSSFCAAAKCTLTIGSPVAVCQGSALMGVTSTSLALISSLLATFLDGIPMAMQHLPIALVSAFIASLSRVYGVLPGIGSHAIAMAGLTSKGSRYRATLTRTK
jgi:hypothetical protein